jgi:hypothetical protein
MAFMFKGPASLTSGSVIPAASVHTALSAEGVDLTIGDDLTVTDDLTVKDVIIANTGSLTINGSSAISSIEGSGTALVTKNYVDTAISNTHKVSVLTSVTSGSYGTVDLSTHHVYYFANTSYKPGTSTQLTCTIATSPIPADGHRIFIAWSNRGNANNASLKLDFGSAIVQGDTNRRYLLFNGIHANGILYHTTTTDSGSQWYLIESHGSLSVSAS